MPYFLKDAFELYELSLPDRSILLAMSRPKKAHPPTAVRDQLEKLKAASGQPIVYITGALASYERKRLIEQKVPFIVPGNQLYLPDLGIDLREYFRQSERAPRKSFSPATQAMVIRALLSKTTQTAWYPAAMADELGYTPMTVSRVVSELTRAGIATLDQRGRARWLLMERPAAKTWELILPQLGTPIKKEFWARTASGLDATRIPLAGLSALAYYTQLADPKLPVYALSDAQLKKLTAKNLDEIPEPLAGSCQLQVWSYAPTLTSAAKGRDVKVVDPFSLSLAFQDTMDERIDSALEELQEHFPW